MKYAVKNMSCRHCLMRIEKALNDNGVVAMVSLADKSVTSEDTRVPEILAKIGYKAE